MLFAGGGVCGALAFGAVRALVVFPELPVAAGAVGAASDDALGAFPFDSGALALVVLPEFAAGGPFVAVPAAGVVVSLGSLTLALFDLLLLVVLLSAAGASAAGVALEAESVSAFFDFLLLAVLPSPAAGVSPVGGVALAAGSAAALFFVLLFVSGVVLAVSLPLVFPAALFDLDLLVFEVVPAALVEASVSFAVSSAGFFFLVLVFSEVVDVSPGAAGAAVESVESAAGFFFLVVVFFLVVLVESLCV